MKRSKSRHALPLPLEPHYHLGGGEKCDNMLLKLAEIRMDLKYSVRHLGLGQRILKQLHKLFLNLATYFCTPRVSISVPNQNRIASKLSDIRTAFHTNDPTKYNSARLELELTALGVSNAQTKRHGIELRSQRTVADQDHFVETIVRSLKNTNQIHYPQSMRYVTRHPRIQQLASLRRFSSAPIISPPHLRRNPRETAQNMIRSHLRRMAI